MPFRPPGTGRSKRPLPFFPAHPHQNLFRYVLSPSCRIPHAGEASAQPARRSIPSVSSPEMTDEGERYLQHPPHEGTKTPCSMADGAVQNKRFPFSPVRSGAPSHAHAPDFHISFPEKVLVLPHSRARLLQRAKAYIVPAQDVCSQASPPCSMLFSPQTTPHEGTRQFPFPQVIVPAPPGSPLLPAMQRPSPKAERQPSSRATMHSPDIHEEHP